MFTTADGAPLRPDYLTGRFRRLVAASGQPPIWRSAGMGEFGAVGRVDGDQPGAHRGSWWPASVPATAQACIRPCAVVVGSGQGSAGGLSFLGVGVAALADALPLPVQAAYLYRDRRASQGSHSIRG